MGDIDCGFAGRSPAWISEGFSFLLQDRFFHDCMYFLITTPAGAASIQDIVSWMLAAISPVKALRATRMWLSETDHGTLPDLWTAAAVRTPATGGMFSTEEAGSRKTKRVSGLPRGLALLMSQDYGPVSGHVLTPRGYIKTLPGTWTRPYRSPNQTL